MPGGGFPKAPKDLERIRIVRIRSIYKDVERKIEKPNQIPARGRAFRLNFVRDDKP